MRRFLTCFMLLLLGSTAAFAEETALEDVIEKVNFSVVGVIADKDADTQDVGSGIIISSDGYVVTNSHVAEDAQNVTIITADGSEYLAKVIGSDAKTDVALLQAINPVDFIPAEFADSDAVRVGNRVFAIGNPFGLGNSVSSGIISAKERDIEKGPYDNFIQTDAAINQGNSGGALFNMDGQIIGMNTAIFSTDGKNTGVGFATPSNVVSWVVSQLQKNGTVVRGWLGIGVQYVRSSDNERRNKLAVASMSEDSPAAAAGMQVGDVLEDFAHISLSNPHLFSLGIAETEPGSSLTVSVLRDGEIIPLNIVVGTMPEPNEEKNEADEDDEQAENQINGERFPSLGMTLLYDDENRELIVTEVYNGSDAEYKGISIGDRIKSVNKRKVFGLDDLRIKIKQASAEGGRIEMHVIGEETVNSIMIKLKE